MKNMSASTKVAVTSKILIEFGSSFEGMPCITENEALT
jgi:hypothetical protein